MTAGWGARRSARITASNGRASLSTMPSWETSATASLGCASSVPGEVILSVASLGIGTVQLPGLVDLHVHVSLCGPESLPLWLANGVTSIRDIGGDPATLLPLRAELAAGRRIGPRLFVHGPMLDGIPMPERFAPLQVEKPEAPAAASATAPAVVHEDEAVGDTEDGETPPQAGPAKPALGAAQQKPGSSVYLSDKELLEAQSATDDGEVEE